MLRWRGCLVLFVGLAACGGGGGDSAPTTDGAGGAGNVPASGSMDDAEPGAAEASDLPADVPINELTESERASFCSWVTAKAEAYAEAWTAERLCSFVAMNLALASEPTDLDAARQACEVQHDSCLAEFEDLVLLPCSVLTTCTGTVEQVRAYYDITDAFGERVTTCPALELDALDGVGLDQITVLPNCTLVGTPR